MLDASQLLYTQIAAVVCLLIFAGLLYDMLRLRRAMEASKAWIRVDGEIVSSEAKIPPSHTSDDQSDVDPVVLYRYKVGDRVHQSERVKFGGQASLTRAMAEILVAKYPPGAHVDVYYDPRDPTSAVLEPRKKDSLVAKSVFALTFAVVAGVLVAHAIAGKVLYAGKGVPLFAFLLPLVAFLVAGLGIVSFVRARRQASASANWPTASGTVTTSTVIEERVVDKRHDDEGDSTGCKQKQLRYNLRYRVDLRYVYQVALRDYVGTSWAWGWTPIYGLREQAEKVLAGYPKGQAVTVYYDPSQPDVAVLEPNSRQGSLAPLIFAAIFAAGGAGFLMFFIRIGFGH